MANFSIYVYYQAVLWSLALGSEEHSEIRLLPTVETHRRQHCAVSIYTLT